MSKKKSKYKIGDLFHITLINNELVSGHIIRVLGKSILIEVRDANNELIMTRCCWDDFLTNGQWEIYDNLPIDQNHKIPDFGIFDPFNKKYFKITGNTILTGYNENGEVRIEIGEDEFFVLEKYGIHTPETIIDECIKSIKLKDNREFGIWGPGIFQNDKAFELKNRIDELLKAYSKENAVKILVEENNEIIENEQGYYFSEAVLSLASIMIELGCLTQDIKGKVDKIVQNDIGIEKWKNRKDYKERKAILRNFNMFL